MAAPVNDFQEKGYIQINQLFDTSGLVTYMQQLEKNGIGQFDDKYPGSPGFYKNPMFEKIMIHLLPVVERHTGYELFKTFSFGRLYKIGDELKRHVDRNSCQITVSLCISYENDPWPIYLEDKEGNELELILNPGDALIFNGMILPHWRLPNTTGTCSQVFLCYVDKNGPFADFRDDNKNIKEK